MPKLTEPERAKAWREKLGLSIAQLAVLTGYSIESLYWYERGLTPQGGDRKPTPVKDWVWYRYKRICQAVDTELRTKSTFDW